MFAKHRVIAIGLAILFQASMPLSGQQSYVTKFDVYAGYAFLNTPLVSLFDQGVAAQFGFRPKPWYSLGFDYSYSTGGLTVTPNLLPTAKQQALAPLLEAAPPGYSLVVPAHSKTQTFAVGPQLAYRHFKHITLFFRPVFAGAIHEYATPHPAAGDPIAALAVAALAPPGYVVDTTWFLGFGGGIDLIVSKHISFRTQADEVWDHLFNGLLKDGQWTTRFSVGPAFNFGRNIKE
jgi:hypothetical protein